MNSKPAYPIRLVALALAAHFAVVPAVFAQNAPSEADQAAAEETRGFSADQIEQLVAPVALYPDALLMQVLMAATYPLEIVEADRWTKKNSDLTGDALDKAAEKEGWDASVQSLTHFPGVLSRMSENLDWTKDLGDAFLGQQADVLNGVQVMRSKAYAAGNLKTTAEQNITVEQAEPSTTTVVVQQPAQIIRIEPAQPQVIYVPTYSPTVVYGPPPATVYYPTVYSPAYVATASVISFGVGLAIGAAIWGDCDWHHHGVYGYPGYYGGGYHGSYWRGGSYHGGSYHGGNYNGGHNNVTINGDVNINGRPGNGGNWNGNNRPGNGNNRPGGGGPPQWGHQPEHRKGVGYTNDKVAKNYGQNGKTRPASSDASRGYDRGGSAQTRPAGLGSDKGGAGSNARPGSGNAGGFGGGAGANNKGTLGGGSAGANNKGSLGGGAGANNKGTLGGGAGGSSNKGSLGGGASGSKNKGSIGGGAGSSNRGSYGGASSSKGGNAFGGRGASVDRAASSRGASSRGMSGGGSGGRSASGGGGRSSGGGGGNRGGSGGGGGRSGGGGGGRR